MRQRGCVYGTYLWLLQHSLLYFLCQIQQCRSNNEKQQVKQI